MIGSGSFAADATGDRRGHDHDRAAGGALLAEGRDAVHDRAGQEADGEEALRVGHEVRDFVMGTQVLARAAGRPVKGALLAV
jgi:hypothetical protein